jgi:benzoyl-CoA reductase/2-hydroxyglutaryl-CoA dehydratase subunit BcrC/BadD/HgdB
MDLEKDGIPVLQLEKEYGAKADFGRIRTRVQAFLEKIGDRRKVGDRA